MIALIMAGGRGSRLGGVCKPMVRVCGVPMILRVLAAIRGLVSAVVIALSHWTRECLKDLCLDPIIDCVETSGADYVEDLKLVVSSLRKPVLVLPADLPHLGRDHVDLLLSEAQRRDGVCVLTLEGPRGPVGASLFQCEGGSWVSLRIDDPRLVSVNTVKDLELAEALCREGSWR